MFYRILPTAVIAVLLAACQASEPPALEPENPTFDAVIASSDHYPGFLDSYRDKATGDLYLVIRPDQLDTDILYFSTFLDGNDATGTPRGYYGSRPERILQLRRHYDDLQVLERNTRFFFDPDNALARAADANLQPALLAVVAIVDEDEDGNLLVPANAIFLDESLQQVKPAADPEAEPGSQFELGELSETRSYLETVYNYPENTDVVVTYVYENPAPLVQGSEAITDSRFVNVRHQHSFLAAPAEPMEPRFEDARVGYFTNRVTDMTDTGPTPWRDPINRWKLEKKNPGAELSDPVEPIVFWLENTTPVEFRDTVRDAVLVWNRAFEDAGFSNAIEVRQQPDDADWDARDIRYNVLRWTSSSESTWAGLGPSWTDPRSGQILGADVMLEFSWIRTHVQREQTFGQAMLPPLRGNPGHARCQAGEYKKQQLILGRILTDALGNPAAEVELVRQAMYDLVTHEVGHVLGLRHNFRASYYSSADELVRHEGLGPDEVAASVMDYPAVNYAAEPVAQPRYNNLEPGVYDRWAIEFGYSEALADPAAERERQQAILARSTLPGHGFGIDSDAMWGPNFGIDPRVMVFDLGRDPVVYAAKRLALVERTAGELLSRFDQEGDSWQGLYNAYIGLSGEQARQLVVASRWVGGVYMDRAVQGQEGADKPFTPVERERQKQAMELLSKHLFAPDALVFDADLYRHLQRQRRGDDYRRAQNPTVHARVLAIQQRVLSYLLDPVTTTRINDSALYGNDYPLSEVMSDLTAAIFAADMQGPVDTLRQQLQQDYVGQLLVMADPEQGSGHDHITRSLALYTLKELEKQLAEQQRSENVDVGTRAHRVALRHRIEQGLYERG